MTSNEEGIRVNDTLQTIDLPAHLTKETTDEVQAVLKAGKPKKGRKGKGKKGKKR